MSDETLPPFSGDEPTCAKCGNEGASTEYRGHGRCLHEGSVVIGVQLNERLHRECRRCDYAWDEALAEATSKPSGRTAVPEPVLGRVRQAWANTEGAELRLAELGMDPMRLRDTIDGYRRPRDNDLHLIATACDVPIEWLVGGGAATRVA